MLYCAIEVKLAGVWCTYNQPHMPSWAPQLPYWLGLPGYTLPRGSKEVAYAEPKLIDFNDTTPTVRLLVDPKTPIYEITPIEAMAVQERFTHVYGDDARHPPLFGYVMGNYIDTHIRYPGDVELYRERGFSAARVLLFHT
jgi:hypothetical protein